MYSLGIVLFELYHPFKTEMERSRLIQDLRTGRHDPPDRHDLSDLQAGRHDLPDPARLVDPDIEQLIYQLTDTLPDRRPSARQLLSTRFSNQQREALNRSAKSFFYRCTAGTA
jgi:serine/threonine protein kinase